VRADPLSTDKIHPALLDCNKAPLESFSAVASTIRIARRNGDGNDCASGRSTMHDLLWVARRSKRRASHFLCLSTVANTKNAQRAQRMGFSLQAASHPRKHSKRSRAVRTNERDAHVRGEVDVLRRS
jgi:hypothetical protein